VDLVEESAVFAVSNPHWDPESQTFEEAVKRDPIALGRVVVRTVRASGQRRVHFTDVIKVGNEKKHFFLGDVVEIMVPDLQLLRDVRTRWDSIYFMIHRLRVLRPVCDCHDVMLLVLMVLNRLLIISSPCRQIET
jgi:hypothetical protein